MQVFVSLLNFKVFFCQNIIIKRSKWSHLIKFSGCVPAQSFIIRLFNCKW